MIDGDGKMQTSNPELLEVEAKGVRLTYVQQGKGDPIVFVHGHFIDYRSWTFQIGPFAERFRTIAYNRRYAYPNKRTGDYSDNTIENNASDLLVLMEKLGVGRAHLVTVSTGSFIALYFAVRHPELVKTLVLMEPAIISLVIKNPKSKAGLLSYALRHPSSARAMMRLRSKTDSAKAAYEKGDAKGAARIFVDTAEALSPQRREPGEPPLFDRLPPVIQTSFVENMRDLEQGMAVVEDPVFTCDDARKISAPVLLIRSTPAVYPMVDKLSKCLPNAEVVFMKHPGDQGRWLEPYPFNSVVLEFLSRHS